MASVQKSCMNSNPESNCRLDGQPCTGACAQFVSFNDKLHEDCKSTATGLPKELAKKMPYSTTSLTDYYLLIGSSNVYSTMQRSNEQQFCPQDRLTVQAMTSQDKIDEANKIEKPKGLFTFPEVKKKARRTTT